MEIPAKYNPSIVEDKWYKFWLENRFFHSEPDDRESYSIVIPPPNVTGVLHMGHMLNNTIQDVLIRRARLNSKNVCWVPGTDHASIATEAKVVSKLKSEGIDKSSLTRDEFLKHAWEWKEKHGGIILEQLKKLGASCDWERTKFTMDPDLSEAVLNTFVYFYNKGLIYRGVRMVNWDPQGQTAVSDEEVIYKEVSSKLYYLKYYLSENGIITDKYLTIATTRPETIMADVALCVNPKDERYRSFVGKTVSIPLINREIPVIEDDYVTSDFGTGCLKITPAHDINDYEIGLKHKLPVIDIIDQKGVLNEKALILVGLDRFEARKVIIKMLKESGNLDKEEAYTSQVGHSERTDSVIEPKLSLQWFLKMSEPAKKALEYVESGKIKLIPDKYRNTYKHWMENARDWCISRQLWWGQRIPAYYLPNGEVIVASSIAKAEQIRLEKYPQYDHNDLKQDEDVLDTWFSSWLWPISVFDPTKPGFPDKKGNKDLEYYFPTNDLVTAPEILFFWVARMVMASDEFTGTLPFRNVYLTGTVRDKLGRKMSKSLGNSPDPIKLMEEYGADGVRVGMLLCSSAGNDILFDESQVEQGRNFSNKIWNAFRLVKGWSVSENIEQPLHSKISVEWFSNRLEESKEVIEDHFSKFRISDALMHIYKLFWDDFCSWHLEIIKPSIGSPIDKETYDKTIKFFEDQLILLHPFMPFITEELWSTNNESSIMNCRLNKSESFNRAIIEDFEIVKSAIVNIRSIRQSKGISNRESLILNVKGQFSSDLYSIFEKISNCKIEKLSTGESSSKNVSFLVGTTEFNLQLGDLIDTKEELKKIDEEISYFKKFLLSVDAKLSNEKFISSAPKQVIDIELKKKSDATTKIEILSKRKEELSKDV